MHTPKKPSDTRAGLFTIGIMAAGLMVIYRHDLWSGSDLFFKAFRDPNPFTVWYPWSRLTLMSLGEGLFPLWNPYNLLGNPLLANYQSATLSPLLMPLWSGAFEWMVVPYLFLRLMAAGFGAFLFARRLGVSEKGATITGLAFGLTGYFTQYVNDQHIVIDLLMPYLLLSIRGLVIARSTRYLLFTILATVLVLLGGQPSSALFTLALGYGYGAFLASCRGRGSTLIPLAMAGALALLICSAQVLPFLELIPRAWNYHQPGQSTTSLILPGILTLVAPGIFGPLDLAREFAPIISLAPYLGALPVTLALAATIAKPARDDLFFAAVSVTAIAVMAGLPVFSWIMRAPLLDRLTYIKYAMPLAAFSVAFLAGKGTDAALAGRFKPVALASLAVCALCLAGLFLLWPSLPRARGEMAGAVAMACIFSAAAAGAALVASRKKPAHRLLIIMVLAELVLASLVNRPFMHWNVARHDFSALADLGTADPAARIWAAEDVMLPNMGILAPARQSGISDALILAPSMELARAASQRTEDEFFREFMRFHSFRLPADVMGSPLTRLMGVRYWISKEPLPPNQTLPDLLDKARVLAPSPAHVAVTRIRTGDGILPALFAHAPARVEAPVCEEGMIFARPMVDAAVSGLAGDGAWFAALSGKSLAYARYLDPRVEANPSMTGIRCDGPLTLATHPGENSDHDWSLWGDLRGRPPYTPDRTIGDLKVHDRGPVTFAYVADRVLVVTGEEEAVAALLISPVPGTAVVESDSGISGSAGGEVLSVEAGLQNIELRIRSAGPSLVVVSSAFCAGWVAKVNGVETHAVRTNLALTGVMAPAGESVIEMVYSPRAFRIGLWASISAVTACAACLCWRRIRRDRSYCSRPARPDRSPRS